MKEPRPFAVWKPSIEDASKSIKVDAYTHGQAAFLAANERKIGHRGATLAVFDGKERRMVTLEPRTWYAVVGVSEPLAEAPMGNETA